MISCEKCTRTFKSHQEYDNHWELHKPSLKSPCWECEVREAEVLDRYCKVCNEKAEWINDFYEQFGD